MVLAGEGNAGLAVSASDGIFGSVQEADVSQAGSFLIGKSVPTIAAGASAQIPSCPNHCDSGKVFRAGLRRNKDQSIKQRWLCTCCGSRFVAKSLNTSNGLSFDRQICAMEAKNLVSTTEVKAVVGDAKLSPDVQGLLVKFCSYLEKEAYSEENDYPKLLKHLAVVGADLSDPESVKAAIAKMTYVNRAGDKVKVKDGTKMLYCAAYGVFAVMQKIAWVNPGYKQEEIEVYVPYESELDALIVGASSRSRRMAAFLQTLKETFADPSEALRIRWIDVDFNACTIKINFPVKNHNTGTLQVSRKLLSMLSALPHNTERVFPTSYENISECYRKMRRCIASAQADPRILAVELRGFRHWGGTKIAFETNGNVLIVKKLLRHKAIKSTMKYIGRIDFRAEEYETTAAASVEEILKLGQAGWVEYSVVRVGGQEVHCFRKPKPFGVSPELGVTSQNLGLNTYSLSPVGISRNESSSPSFSVVLIVCSIAAFGAARQSFEETGF